MRVTRLSTLAVAAALCVSARAAPQDARAREWLQGAASAMGGEPNLRSLTGIEISGISVLYQREQSERPEGPWIPTFTEFTDRRNAAGTLERRSRTRGFVTEDDAGWSPESITLMADDLAFGRTPGGLRPAGTPWDLGMLPDDLRPDRCLLAALDSPDLRAEPDMKLHGYAHHVVAFTHGGARVRVILNVPGLLPKAIEVTRARPFDSYWAPWGDVTHRVTFGVWLLETGGFRYPRLWEFSTGGAVDGSVDVTRVRVNPPLTASDFEIPAAVRESAMTGRRRIADLPLGSQQRPAVELAAGIVKVPASFDVLEVKQDAGIVIVESPLTSAYSAKVIEDAERRLGGKVTALITTSDSWPHIGGLREYVARRIPVYALDLNLPILQRLLAAPFETEPDALARSRVPAVLKPISARTVVGAGANRIELYPLRSAAGERQMMAYFPEHKLLYTSDLFTIRGEMVFLPEMVSEAVDAARREHLEVTRAFGMHYDVLPWETVVSSGIPKLRK